MRCIFKRLTLPVLLVGQLAQSAQAYTADDAHALAFDIAHGWQSTVDPTSLEWNWKPAVLMRGIQAVYENTGDSSLRDWNQAWIDYHIDRGYRIHKSDQVVPCTSALWLWSQLGDDKYLAPVEDCEAYLNERAPRLEDGSYAHAVAVPQQIWVDSLFMLGTFWTMNASLAQAEGDFDTVAEQFELFAGHLLSTDGLYRHMYDGRIDRAYPFQPVYWGRGNGWVLASLALLLTELPADHPERPALESLFITHATAIAKLQAEDGRWYTVIDQYCDSYLETSATALFSFGLLRGAHLGLLDDAALTAGERGVDALFSQVDPDGAGFFSVTGISGSTNPGPCRYYARVPLTADEPHGVGAVLLALSER